MGPLNLGARKDKEMPQTSELRVNINYQDLEKLFQIEDNPQLRIEILQGVAQTFADRHLKGIVTPKMIEDLVNPIKAEVKAEINRIVYGNTNQWGGSALSSTMKQQIRDAVNAEVKEEVTAKVQELRAGLEESIKSSVSSLLNATLTTRIDSEVRTLVRDRIKNLAGDLFKE